MSGETALDTSTAIRYLNRDSTVVARVTAELTVVLPLTVVGELLFGAENSARPLRNVTQYLQFIEACRHAKWSRETTIDISTPLQATFRI